MAKNKNPNLDNVIDAGRVESPIDPVDDEVSEQFKEAEHLGQGRGLARKLHDYTDKQPELTGGDLDAAWEQADNGDETIGGDNPTPDQDVVDELGVAAGITYNDSEPLHTTEKLQERDKNRWELDPASSEDFAERNSDMGGSRKASKKKKK